MADCMTGPGHYEAGQAALDEANVAEWGSDRERYCIGAAQAHFTAALAAATALAACTAEGMPVRDRQAWIQAAGTPAPPDDPDPRPHLHAPGTSASR